MRAQPLDAARRSAEHQLVLPREPAEGEAEQRQRESVQPVGGAAHRPHRRAGAQVQVQTRDLIGSGLAHEPGGEKGFAQLVEDARARSLAQVQLGKLLRNGRATLRDPCQISRQRAHDPQRTQGRHPARPVEESAVLVTSRRGRHQGRGA